MAFELLAATQSSTYLNTGAAGPLTAAAYDAILEELEWEFVNGRVGSSAKDRFFTALDDLKIRLSRLLCCSPEEIAVVESTTVALNIAIWGLNLGPDDAVLTTDSEHIGALAGLFTLRERSGVSIQNYNGGHFDMTAFFEQADASTRAILISHVSWRTGEVYPLKAMCAEARARGLITIVDGAQAFGAMPVDLGDLAPDFYAFPAQKWTLGPEGIAGLFVSGRVLGVTKQTFAGPFSFASHGDYGQVVPSTGASRFEVGSRFRSTVQGWAASLRWMEEAIGWSAIYEGTSSGQKGLRHLLRPIPRLRLIEAEEVAGLTAIELPDHLSSAEVVQELERRNIKIRAVPGGNRVRASTAFFNENADFQRLASALEEVLGI